MNRNDSDDLCARCGGHGHGDRAWNCACPAGRRIRWNYGSGSADLYADERTCMYLRGEHREDLEGPFDHASAFHSLLRYLWGRAERCGDVFVTGN